MLGFDGREEEKGQKDTYAGTLPRTHSKKRRTPLPSPENSISENDSTSLRKARPSVSLESHRQARRAHPPRVVPAPALGHGAARPQAGPGGLDLLDGVPLEGALPAVPPPVVRRALASSPAAPVRPGLALAHVPAHLRSVDWLA